MAQILPMSVQERFRATAAFVAQHAKKAPFGIELGGIAKVGHRRAGDAVDAHSRPSSALAIAGIGHLPQHRDHA